MSVDLEIKESDLPIIKRILTLLSSRQDVDIFEVCPDKAQSMKIKRLLVEHGSAIAPPSLHDNYLRFTDKSKEHLLSDYYGRLYREQTKRIEHDNLGLDKLRLEVDDLRHKVRYNKRTFLIACTSLAVSISTLIIDIIKSLVAAG